MKHALICTVMRPLGFSGTLPCIVSWRKSSCLDCTLESGTRLKSVDLPDQAGAHLFVDGRYCASLDCAEQMDRGLLAAVWVLIDFIEQVEYHSVSDFPAKIIFFAEGEVYEIIYVEQGKETMISHLLSVPREEPSKYLVLVEDLSQIQQLDLPPVSGFCTVSSTGEVQYYKKE